MNLKNAFTASLFLTFLSYSAVAQKHFTISPEDLKNLIGCWRGNLNYSGTIIRKPYKTTAELVVKQISKFKFTFLKIYSKQPGDSSLDTITISGDGRKFKDETIKSKRHTSNSNLEIITEELGFDHDYNKSAILRTTYTIGKNIYTYTKEVQLEGQADWKEREQDKFLAKPCTCEKINTAHE